MLAGDLEEAEFSLSMAQSYEAAIKGWRETIQMFEISLAQCQSNQQAMI